MCFQEPDQCNLDIQGSHNILTQHKKHHNGWCTKTPYTKHTENLGCGTHKHQAGISDGHWNWDRVHSKRRNIKHKSVIHTKSVATTLPFNWRQSPANRIHKRCLFAPPIGLPP